MSLRMAMEDLILFGIQGSGKGTQGKILATKGGFRIFETGEELRRLSNEDSPLGKKVKNIIEAGNLVPNEVVMEIVENFLHGVPHDDILGISSVIFDGIPRTLPQADSLETLLAKLGRNFRALYINIPHEKAIERLANRKICVACRTIYAIASGSTRENCEKCEGRLVARSDDTPESIQKRLDLFYKETLPVILRYRKEGKLIEVNGNRAQEEVSADIFKKLNI